MRKELIFLTLLIIFIFTIPLYVFGQTPSPTPLMPPESLDQVSALLPTLIDALLKGQWVIVGAIVTMLLTLCVKLYALPKWNLSNAWLPWVSLLLAFLNGVASNMFLGVPVNDAALMILVSGGLASQIWSLGGKTLIDFISKHAEKK